MNDASFPDAIREDPHDDALRLRYADSLEANGQAARAEWIRASCELAGIAYGDERWDEAVGREMAAFPACKPTWWEWLTNIGQKNDRGMFRFVLGEVRSARGPTPVKRLGKVAWLGQAGRRMASTDRCAVGGWFTCSPDRQVERPGCPNPVARSPRAPDRGGRIAASARAASATRPRAGVVRLAPSGREGTVPVSEPRRIERRVQIGRPRYDRRSAGPDHRDAWPAASTSKGPRTARPRRAPERRRSRDAASSAKAQAAPTVRVAGSHRARNCRPAGGAAGSLSRSNLTDRAPKCVDEHPVRRAGARACGEARGMYLAPQTQYTTSHPFGYFPFHPHGKWPLR